MEMNELNLEEMESISGGDGGYRKQPAAKKGYAIYQIKAGDNLNGIAYKFHTTVEAIMKANKSVLSNPNFIRARFYIYIPQ